MLAVAKPSEKLKTGLTTGCCATACCVAAAYFLLQRCKLSTVIVTLPHGKQVLLHITKFKIWTDRVRAVTIKDAGDDPDATHGAKIFVDLELLSDVKQIVFESGYGVGDVTQHGLVISVGEPAINPVPRQMIAQHLNQIGREENYFGGFKVKVGMEDGVRIATKTMNGRLGIQGGVSILGTTGIVRPFSCSAYIASIRQSMDVAAANGIQHIAAVMGNQSEQAIQTCYQLAPMAFIEMGDFVGVVLKHLDKASFAKITICGGFGKMTKLAMGHMNLHSGSAVIDFHQLALWAQELGATTQLVQLIRTANTSVQVLQSCHQQQIPIARYIAKKAFIQVQQKVSKKINVELGISNRKSQLITLITNNDEK